MEWLASKGVARSRRQAFLELLIKTLARHNMQVVIAIRRRRPHFIPVFSLDRFAQDNNHDVYVILPESGPHPIADIAKLLCKTRPWHRSSFHVVAGLRPLSKRLKQALSEKTMSLEDAESDLKELVVGVVEPLDDALEFYGTSEFAKLISQLDEQALI